MNRIPNQSLKPFKGVNCEEPLILSYRRFLGVEGGIEGITKRLLSEGRREKRKKLYKESKHLVTFGLRLSVCPNLGSCLGLFAVLHCLARLFLLDTFLLESSKQLIWSVCLNVGSCLGVLALLNWCASWCLILCLLAKQSQQSLAFEVRTVLANSK
jgi:hypothetical protein